MMGPRHRFVLCSLLVGCATAGDASAADPRFGDAFWKHWGDGQAELNAYELTQPRYGELRRGLAVAIFVTETFSESLRVKSDPGKHAVSDEFPVMKLNLVRDFPTGVYDYNLMGQTFVQLVPRLGRAAGSVTKVSFSSQEWCGHVYAQVLFDERAARLTSHSYFDGEADESRSLAYPEAGLSEDVLLLWARQLAGPILRPGESRRVPLLVSLARARLDHLPVVWEEATLSRGSTLETLEVPAGRFSVETWSVELAGGRRLTMAVEAAAPRRLIRWQSSTGENALLLGTTRAKYWELNQPGGVSALEKLGLAPRPARMP